MDVLNSYGLAVGVTVGVLSGFFTFFNRERYKTLVTIYQQGNDELRKQRDDGEKEKTELEKRVASLASENKVLERQNLRLPDFAQLTKTISNNHSQQMEQLTDLAKKIAEKK